MKRAKQRKRQFRYCWAIILEPEPEMFSLVSQRVVVPPRGRMFKGEVGKVDCGIKIVEGKK